MPARTFEDSAGSVWEVFEVHRTSQKAEAVSAGLESGWLTFVCGRRKRRLAPFPSEWGSVEPKELERLCGLAREARSTEALARREPVAASDAPSKTARTRVPRIREPRAAGEKSMAGELPILATASSSDSVEATVRAFAQQARSHGLPAIEAMVQLKALLGRVYSSADSDARDLRAVRRWFVETYYFDRDAAPSDDHGVQSR